jgi:hypothetical protein
MRNVSNLKIVSENLKERDHLRDLGVDVRITLKRIWKKSAARVRTAFVWGQ